MSLSDRELKVVPRLDTSISKKRAQKLKNLISKAKSTINMARKMGANTSTAENLLADANSYYVSKRFESAEECATKARKEAEKAKKHKRVEFSILRAEASLSEAMKIGVDVTKGKELIDRARATLESGLYAQAVEYIRYAKRALAEAKRIHYTENLISRVSDVAQELQKKGCQIEKVMGTIGEARASLGREEYGKARTLVSKARKLLREGERHRKVELIVLELREEIEEAKNVDIDVGKIENLLHEAQQLLKAKDYEKTKRSVRKAKRILRRERKRKENEILIKTIEKLIDSAGKGGANLLGARKLLDDVRTTIRKGSIADLSKIMPKESSEAMGRYEENAASLKNLIEEASHFDIDTTQAQDALSKTDESIVGKDDSQLEACIDETSRSTSQLKNSMQETFKEIIARVKERIAEAKRLRLTVSNAEKALLEAEEFLSAQKFSRAMEYVRIAEGIIESLLSKYAEEKSSDIETLLNILPGLSKFEIDSSEAEKMLKSAQRKLSDPESIVFDIHDITQSIEITLRGLSADLISKTKDKIKYAQSLSLALHGVDGVMSKAENAFESGKYSEAMETSVTVENVVESLIAQHLSERYQNGIEDLKKKIEGAKKSGLDVNKAEELLARSKKALMKNELRTIDTILSKANEFIEEKEQELSLTQVKDEMNKLSSASANAQMMGIDTSKVEQCMDIARGYMEKGESPDAIIGQLQKCNRILDNSIRTCALTMLSETQNRVEEALSRSADVTSARNLLMKAQDAINASDYLRAINLIKDSEKEINQALLSLKSSKATSKLEDARSIIDDAKMMGVDIEEANGLIKKSEEALTSGEIEKSFELTEEARKVMELKRKSHLWERIRAETEAMEQAIRALEGAGIDMEQMEGALSGVKNNISSDASESSLEKVLEDSNELKAEIKERAHELLATISESLNTAKQMRIDVQEAEKMIAECEDCINSGNYVQGCIYAKKAKEMIDDSIRNHVLDATQTRFENVKDLIQKAKEFMIEVDSAELALQNVEAEMERCDLSNTEDRKKVHHLINEVEKVAEEAITSQIKRKQPKLTSNLYPMGIQTGSWNKCLLEITNTGQLPATNIELAVEGEIKVKDLKPIEEIAPMEKKIQEIGVMPDKNGKIPVDLTISYHRIFDDSKYVVKDKTNMDVASEGTYKIEDVFLIHNDGRLLSRVTRKCADEIDEDIFSGMLTAVRAFINDSFKEGSGVGIRRLAFSNKNLLIEPGRFLFLSVVVTGGEPSFLPLHMIEIVIEIQKKFGEVLENWSGAMTEVQGIDEILKKLLMVSDIKDEHSKELEKSFVTSMLKELEEAAKSGLDISEDEALIEEMQILAEVKDPEEVWKRTEEVNERLRKKFSTKKPKRYVATLSADDLRQYAGDFIDDEKLKESLGIIKNVVECITMAKEKEGLTQKWPVKRIAVISSSEEITETVRNFETAIKNYTNVKEVEIVPSNEIWDGLNIEIIPNKEAIMKRHKQWPKIILILSRVQSPLKVKRKINEGNYAVGIDGQQVDITPEMIDFKISSPTNIREYDYDWGKMYLDMKQDRDLVGEGFAEELVQRINALKSTLNLGDKLENVEVGAKEEIVELLSPFDDLIGSKTSSENVSIMSLKEFGQKESIRCKIRNEVFSVYIC